MPAIRYFRVEIRRKESWRVFNPRPDGGDHIRGLRNAVRQAQRIASSHGVASRVVDPTGHVLAQFDANGQRHNRKR